MTEPIDPKHIAAINERLAKDHKSDGLAYLAYVPTKPLRVTFGGKEFSDGRIRDELGNTVYVNLPNAPTSTDGLNPDSEARLKLGAAFGSGLVTGFLLMAVIVLVMLSGCSREQPIARQSPAEQQPISSSTDAFNSTDADLDTTTSSPKPGRISGGGEPSGGNCGGDVQRPCAPREAPRAAEAHATMLRSGFGENVATDTAQPHWQPDTRRVTFAGVAFSDRAIATVVQLSSKPCITVYRIVNNVRTNDVDETFCQPQWQAIRIADPGAAVKFDIIRNPSLSIHRRFYRASFRDTQSVTLPVGVDGPIANVRIIVIGMDAQGSQVFMLPDTRLVDLPKWVEP